MNMQTLLKQASARLKSLLTYCRDKGIRSPGKWLLGIVACTVVGGGYLAYAASGGEADAVVTSVATVTKRDIVSSVKATGTVSFSREQQLKFNQRGRVAKVHVQAGDSVKQGQLLAELEKSTITADLRQAQLSVGASALELQQLEADRSKQVLEAEHALQEARRQFLQAKDDFGIAKEQLPLDRAAALREVTEKESALKQAKFELAEAKENEKQEQAAMAQNILTDSEKILDSYYAVLTRSNAARPRQGIYTLEVDYLLNNNPALKQKVEWNYLDALNAANAMRGKYGDNLPAEKDDRVLKNALADALVLAKYVHTLGENTYVLLQGATTDTSTFTVADLESLRSNVNANRNSATQLIQDAQTAQANLLTGRGSSPSIALQQKTDAVTQAENALALSKEKAHMLGSTQPASLEEQQDIIRRYEEDLASKQASLESVRKSVDIQIQLKKNTLSQRAATLQKTSKGVEDYQIVAPFDGVIRRQDYQVGDNLLADVGEDQYIVIENPEFVVVTILLDQVDVVRVQKGDPANITFDAVAGQTFAGTIDAINPIPVEQSGVVSYEVSVQLPTPQSLTILSGMTAPAEIEVEKHADVLTVPNLALKRNGKEVSVQRANGESVTVKTGMTDGRFTEITEGLEENDEVLSINVAARSTTVTTNANPMQIMRGLGGGGPQGGGGQGTNRPTTNR